MGHAQICIFSNDGVELDFGISERHLPQLEFAAVNRERLPELFDGGNQAPVDSERQIAQLHQRIGQ